MKEQIKIDNKLIGENINLTIIGKSQKLIEIVGLVDKIANIPINTLITGESGTGKEVAARLIHNRSYRVDKPFVAINCAALPESLVESELFGIEKGVATGVEKRKGKIELSSGGTLFLDEVGDMSLSTQAKLLRVIQEKTLKRVGGQDDIRVDLRLVAATNKDLVSEIKRGNFREDLFYRLNEIHIQMPPLRDIKECIPILVNYFLVNFSKELNKRPISFDKKALQYLTDYPWPGNVRELKNEVKRLAVLSENDEITENDLAPHIVDYSKGKKTGTLDFIESGKSLEDKLEEIEIQIIKEALIRTGGNRVKTSEILRISRQGLIKKIKRYGIEEEIEYSTSKQISNQISARAKRIFVGREEEIAVLKKSIESKPLPFYVIYIHGIGGIGKTFLVQKVLSSMRAKIKPITLDCREIEPTEAGFLSSLAKQIDLDSTEINLTSIINKLESIEERKVMVLDTYETFGLLDTWIRSEFVPKLPDSVLTLIISRQPPKTAWYTQSGLGSFFKEIELDELSYDESMEFLNLWGVSTKHSEKIYNFTRGHPLALELAAGAFKQKPKVDITHESFPNIIRILTQEFLKGVKPKIREIVESVSIMRRFNESILKLLLSTNYSYDIFDDLLDLPFVYLTNEGYILHDLVRETVAKDLSVRDPEKYRNYRKRAWAYLINESRDKKGKLLWQLTADLLYLIENPVVRDAYFPKGSTNLSVEPATNRDGNDIIEIAKETEPEEATYIIEDWWINYPNTFKVVRNSEGGVEAFFMLCEPQEVDQSKLSRDPITQIWFRHLETNPVESKEKALFMRRWLSKNHGEAPCPGQAACWIDVKRTYMELRPDLRRFYVPIVDVNTYGPIIAPLGFILLKDREAIIGSVTYHSAMNDFGPESIDGWLRRLVGVELGVEN
ncbi:MAG TPA: sigma-54 dependent transcriptional regulator [Thermodesulfobacteriota bacterium]|nr:sigma-54 dependent transcriptional regulator [Thermodesulfobacteriota bacterium]